MHAKFQFDPSNRLATIHQRYRQDTTDNGLIAWVEPFYKRSPKNVGCVEVIVSFVITRTPPLRAYSPNRGRTGWLLHIYSFQTCSSVFRASSSPLPTLVTVTDTRPTVTGQPANPPVSSASQPRAFPSHISVTHSLTDTSELNNIGIDTCFMKQWT